MPNQENKITELEEICERYELATAAANIGVYDWIASSNEVYYSKIWKSQIGYDENELENNFDTWRNLLHPDESEEVQRKAQEYIENPIGQYVNEFRFQHKNGSYRWILAKAEALLDEQGKLIRLYGSHTDITDRKETELELRAIYNQSSEGITLADVDGNYVFVNPAFCKMSGYSEEELLKLTVFDMKGENQDHSSFDKTKESPQIIRVVLKKKDGTEYYSEIVGDVILFNNEKLVLGTIRDVSAQVLAEKKIVELNGSLELTVKERTEELNKTIDMKELLLKEVTHRVKNNLQVICSILNLQKAKVKSEESSMLLIDTVDRIHAMSLIHETLYQSKKIGEVKFAEYMKSLLEYVSATFDTSEIDIATDIDDAVLSMDVASSCGMIVMELMTNSLKHAFPKKQNSKIAIGMSIDAGKQCVVSVQDNGVGYPDVNFSEAKSIGMQLVLSLSEQLDGKVNITNEEGAKFELIFSHF